LVWGIAALFSNCFAGLPFMLYSEAGDRHRAGKRAAAGGLWLCSLLFAALWLGLVGYCGYRAYKAIP
jgi:hypothetical protein